MNDFWKLVTVFVAAAAVYLAWLQVHVAKERLKLDLFEKRFEVFTAARTLIAHVFKEADVTLPQIHEFWAPRGLRLISCSIGT